MLSHYKNICKLEEFPAYLITKYIPVKFSKDESTKQLWEKHNTAIAEKKISEELPHSSLLDLKIELASRLYSNCSLCEHNCNVNREHVKGYCNVSTSRIASEFLHTGEETILVPSHTIFFSGCTFKCIFCQNWDISQYQSGRTIQPKDMAQRISDRMKNGSRNVNWVGGDPTPNILFILQTLKHLDEHIPQIWNSNMYCSIQTMMLLHGIVDVYLADYKFGRDTCAENLSKAKHYTEIITRNIKMADSQAEVLIRHLIIPNHISCCSLPIVHWIGTNLSHVPINIMDQYQPCYKAKENPLINRTITKNEYETVMTEAKRLGIYII